MQTRRIYPTSGCPLLSRRYFLAGAGAAGATAAAAQVGLFEFASSLFAAETKPAGKPVVNVVFIRPEKPLVVSWPGGNCDTKAQQALFTKTLKAAAKKLDVDLRVQDKPMVKADEVRAYLGRLKKSPPDGLIIGAMCLFRWGPVQQILKNRGDIPTIIYSHLSGFTAHLQTGRKTPGVLMGATQSVEWLEMAVRMLNAVWRLKHSKIIMPPRKGGRTTTLAVGTRIAGCGSSSYDEELKKVDESDEMRAIADFYARNAKKIVEPTKQDILLAVKNYVALRRLIQLEKAQGVTFPGCLRSKNPPCLAFSKLRDEGVVAMCEGCGDQSAQALLTFLLFDKPTFVQDPSPNTINNTLIGAHCTSATKLEGINKPYRAPYLIRNFHTRTGVSMQVLWPVGKEVTIAQLSGRTLMMGTGRVVSNIAQPPSGCCRTAVEITVDGCDDTRDVKGFHQLFILGNLERPFRQFAKLAGIEVSRIY